MAESRSKVPKQITDTASQLEIAANVSSHDSTSAIDKGESLNEKTTLEEHDTPNDDNGLEAAARTISSTEPIYSTFSPGMKRFIITMAALSALFSPLSSFIYLPAINALATYYGQSIAHINLSVTTYQILQGLAPMFYGNMADTIGRRPVFVLTFVVYECANLGLALQNSYAALMVLRAMQSAGSSCTIALGAAVVADVASPAERAGFMGYVNAGIMLGPALAPVIGGLVTEYLGWRWIFWILLMINGAYLVFYVVINPETCRNVVDDGSIPPPQLNKTVIQLYQDARRKRKGILSAMASEAKQLKAAELAAKRSKFRFPNPVASLQCILEKDVALVMAYQSIMVSAFYAVMVPITPVFASIYNFNNLQVGLCFIPFAAGSAAGSVATGKLLDWNFRRTAAKCGIKVDRRKAAKLREFPIQKARLQYIFFPNLLAAAAILCWGWALAQKPNLAAPLIIEVFAAFGSTASSTTVNTLLVDLYPQSPATVMAANNVVRCLVAAAASAVIQYMINGLGLGWAYTVIAGIVVLFSSLLVLVMKIGPACREARIIKMEKQEVEERERTDRLRREIEEQRGLSGREGQKVEREK